MDGCETVGLLDADGAWCWGRACLLCEFDCRFLLSLYSVTGGVVVVSGGALGHEGMKGKGKWDW